LEKPVTESKKLALLRDELIRRRREIVEHLQTASLDQDAGDDLARIQSTIDAVAKAIAEEQYAEFRP
jgi:Na+/phosphate symporter